MELTDYEMEGYVILTLDQWIQLELDRCPDNERHTNGDTKLHSAMFYWDKKTIDRLKSKMWIKNNDGFTAFHLALMPVNPHFTKRASNFLVARPLFPSYKFPDKKGRRPIDIPKKWSKM